MGVFLRPAVVGSCQGRRLGDSPSTLAWHIPTCAFGNVSLEQKSIGPPGTYLLCYRKLAEALQTRKLASLKRRTFSTCYVALLARTLATQPWRFARFSGSDKSLYEFTLNPPSSSITVKMERESYSSLSPSGVWNTVVIYLRRYTNTANDMDGGTYVEDNLLLCFNYFVNDGLGRLDLSLRARRLFRLRTSIFVTKEIIVPYLSRPIAFGSSGRLAILGNV